MPTLKYVNFVCRSHTAFKEIRYIWPVTIFFIACYKSIWSTYIAVLTYICKTPTQSHINIYLTFLLMINTLSYTYNNFKTTTIANLLYVAMYVYVTGEYHAVLLWMYACSYVTLHDKIDTVGHTKWILCIWFCMGIFYVYQFCINKTTVIIYYLGSLQLSLIQT